MFATVGLASHSNFSFRTSRARNIILSLYISIDSRKLSSTAFTVDDENINNIDKKVIASKKNRDMKSLRDLQIKRHCPFENQRGSVNKIKTC
jgi:hypothetical protein